MRRSPAARPPSGDLVNFQKAKGVRLQGRDKDGNVRRSPGDTTETLSDLGISKGQSSRWQALANVPEEDFEAALGADKKPTASGIIAKPSQMPATSLWLWGRLRDFEHDGLLEMNSEEATELMTDAMVADVKRLAPRVAEWLEELVNDIG